MLDEELVSLIKLNGKRMKYFAEAINTLVIITFSDYYFYIYG